MSIRPIIRKNARDSLRHHWGRAIGMLLFLICVNVLFLLLEQLFCYLLSLNIPEEPALVVDLLQGRLRLTGSMAIVTLTFAVVSFVLTTPLCFGMAKWYYHQVGGERPSLQILFTCFYSMKELWRSIVLRILLAVRILFWRAVFSIPAALLFLARRLLAGWKSDYALFLQVGLFTLQILVSLILTVLWFVFIQRYFLAGYLFVSGSGEGLHAMIRRSVRIMKGNCRETAALLFSFFPWFLLSVLMIPLLFVLPYLYASMAINARVLLERDTRKQEAQSDN